METGQGIRAVVSGDVVASTALSAADRARLPLVLHDVYEELRSRRSEALPYELAVYGGDSWQAYVAEPPAALVLALYMRARLRETLGIEVRVAIAIDRVDFVRPESISESDGPAFRNSGRTLTQLDRDDLFRIVLPEDEDDRSLRLAMEGVADLADVVARGWSPAQAQAVSHLLAYFPEDRRQRDVADAWRPEPISQSAVNQHLQSAGWRWIAKALDRFDTLAHILIIRNQTRQTE